MLRLLATLLSVSLAYSASIPNDTRSGRILGGQEAAIGQFPHQASMRSAANAHFCGGFMINLRHVGSAAHCTINRTPANTISVLGAHHRITGGVAYQTAEIFNHPDFDRVTLRYDICVVRTTVPIIETPLIQRMPLDSAYISTYQGAQTSGWGWTSDPGTAAETLQWLTVDVITQEDCVAGLPPAQAANIDETMLCVTTPPGTGMCFGDSGSPIVVNQRVVGAVAWGLSPCGSPAPNMYARVSAAYNWMMNHATAV